MARGPKVKAGSVRIPVREEKRPVVTPIQPAGFNIPRAQPVVATAAQPAGFDMPRAQPPVFSDFSTLADTELTNALAAFEPETFETEQEAEELGYTPTVYTQTISSQDYGAAPTYETPDEALSNYNALLEEVQQQQAQTASVYNYNNYDPGDFARAGFSGPSSVGGQAASNRIAEYLRENDIPPSIEVDGQTLYFTTGVGENALAQTLGDDYSASGSYQSYGPAGTYSTVYTPSESVFAGINPYLRAALGMATGGASEAFISAARGLSGETLHASDWMNLATTGMNIYQDQAAQAAQAAGGGAAQTTAGTQAGLSAGDIAVNDAIASGAIDVNDINAAAQAQQIADAANAAAATNDFLLTVGQVGLDAFTGGQDPFTLNYGQLASDVLSDMGTGVDPRVYFGAPTTDDGLFAGTNGSGRFAENLGTLGNLLTGLGGLGDLPEGRNLSDLIELATSQGRDGIDGAAGAAGADGRDGVDGATGATGAAGAAGRDGTDGRDGVDGAAGRDGVDGAQGIQGERGATGATGATGAQGERGERGETGTFDASALEGLATSEELADLSTLSNEDVVTALETYGGLTTADATELLEDVSTLSTEDLQDAFENYGMSTEEFTGALGEFQEAFGEDLGGIASGIEGLGTGLEGLGEAFGAGVEGLGQGIEGLGEALGTGLGGLGQGLFGLGIGQAQTAEQQRLAALMPDRTTAGLFEPFRFKTQVQDTQELVKLLQRRNV